MDTTVVKNAVGSLDRLLSEAKQTLHDVERERYGDHADREAGGYEYPVDAMEEFLEELYDILLVILEAADMPQTRASLIEAWSGFTGGKGLRHVKNNDGLQSCESPALTFLERIIQGLRMTVSEAISSEEAWTLHRLEITLRDTAALVHRRPAPANEQQFKEIMHDYLRACFPGDFRPNPHIGGGIKAFKPDCGIASVRAAIELKFVRTKEEVPVAYSGVAEDTAGYKGSRDWTRFYSVIYQAEPFVPESEFSSDLKRIGATTWKAFVVNGPTAKKQAGEIKARKQKKRKNV